MKRNRISENEGMKSALMPYVKAETEQIGWEEKVPHEYSAASMAKINGILSAASYKQRRVPVSRRIAAVCAAVMLMAGVTCAAVEPIRERIANAFLRQDTGMVLVDFDDSESW